MNFNLDKGMEVVKKYNLKNYIIVFCIGAIILIVLSSFSNSETTTETIISAEYSTFEEIAQSYEEKLAELLSSIDGAGQCQVMLTFENDGFVNYLVEVTTDYQITSDGDISDSYSEEVIIINNQDGADETIVLSRQMPDVKGVAVVCEGGDNEIVKEQLYSAIKAIFDIGSSKISITKLTDETR